MNPTGADQAFRSDADASGPGAEDSRVLRAVEEYLAALEEGQPPERDEFLARHAAIAGRLGDYLDGLELIHRAGSAAGAAADSGAAGENLAGTEPLGDFLLVRELGRGGMGVVYEAMQLSLGRRVALKVLPFAAALDARQLRRFQFEAQAAASLHHTNIVPVYAVGSERGVHYYAMQYIEGHDLATLIQQLQERARKEAGSRHRPVPAIPDQPTVPHAPPPEPAAASASPSAETAAVAAARSATEHSWPGAGYARAVARLGIQAAEALEHAHQLGVIHRDIKPANLLLDGRDHLWITDFGLAQLQTDSRLTMTGDLLGTLRYMSPEQALAQRVGIDHRSDVYSLGATLYELLTLEPVFPGRDRQVLLRQIAFEEPRPLRRLDRAIPAELETIVLKALEKNPADRYATAQALADDLGRFLEDEPIRARRPGVAHQLRKWGRRHRGVMATALAGSAVALVGLVLVLSWHNRELGQAAEREHNLSTEARKEAQRAEGLVAKVQEEKERVEALNSFLLEDLLGEATPEKNARQKKVTVEEVLDKAAAKVEKNFGGRPDLEALVRQAIGGAYLDLGLYERARPQLERAVDLRQKRLGTEHPLTLATLNQLALLLHLQGKLTEAEPLLRQNLEATRRVQGTDHPDTLQALNNLAVLLQDQGKVAEAEPLLRQNVEDLRRVLGPDHPLTLGSVNNLAGWLTDQGRLAEAETLHRHNLEARRRLQGAEHPATLNDVTRLAGLLVVEGKLAEAEPLLRQTLEAHRRVFGPDHPDTLQVESYLAVGLTNQGRLAEAEPLHRQNLVARRRVFGTEHLGTLTEEHNLAYLLRELGKVTEAEALMRQNLEAHRRTLGACHPFSLRAEINLAALLLDRGLLSEADPLLRQNLEALRRVRGPDHPDTLLAIHYLAGLLKRQGQLCEAEQLAHEALQRGRKALPPEHHSLAENLTLLGDLLTTTGRVNEAEPLLREALGRRQKNLPPGHRLTAEAEGLLGACLLAQKRYAEAEPLLLSGYRGLEKAPGTIPADRAQCCERLVKLYEDWGKTHQAEVWRKELQPKQASLRKLDPTKDARPAGDRGQARQ